MQIATPDIIVLVVCGLFALRGAFKGFAWQAVRTVGFVGAILAANLFHERLGVWVEEHLPGVLGWLPSAAIAWIAIAVGVFLVIGLFAYMARGFMRKADLTGPDRFLGFGLGAATGFLFCTLAFSVYGSFHKDEDLRETFASSHAVRYMAVVVKAVKPLAPEPIRDHWMHVLESLRDVVPEAG